MDWTSNATSILTGKDCYMGGGTGAGGGGGIRVSSMFYFDLVEEYTEDTAVPGKIYGYYPPKTKKDKLVITPSSCVGHKQNCPYRPGQHHRYHCSCACHRFLFKWRLENPFKDG